jgi:hypothetical protein
VHFPRSEGGTVGAGVRAGEHALFTAMAANLAKEEILPPAGAEPLVAVEHGTDLLWPDLLDEEKADGR